MTTLSPSIFLHILAAHLTAAVAQPVSGLSLAAFRIALGALLVWDCWRFIMYDRIWRYYVAPEFHFTYSGFGWVTPLPEPWIQLVWLAMGLFAFLVAIGLFYRASIVALTLTFSYFFLLDKAEYLNHFYLVILFLVLMCFLPAHRALSLDARLFPRIRATHVPYAAIFMLRVQMEIMLIFAGLVKLTPDWLAGEPLGLWLRAQVDDFAFGFLFGHDWAILAGSWATVALHLVGAPLLLWHKTRFPTFLVYCAFHSANAMFFNIGIFPWLTIAATTIFFAPDWPLRWIRWLHGRFEELPAARPVAAPAAFALPAAVLVAMAGWVAVQIALPLRAGAFPTEVRWSGDGHRFSWRMRIYDRRAEGVFQVTADGQEWEVDPTDYLTARQASKMLVRSDMIHQFAGHLERIWQQAGYTDVEVRAEIRKSLNGRPPQLFVDPEVDLSAAPLQIFRRDPWVLPIGEPVWGVAQNRAADSDIRVDRSGETAGAAASERVNACRSACEQFWGRCRHSRLRPPTGEMRHHRSFAFEVMARGTGRVSHYSVVRSNAVVQDRMTRCSNPVRGTLSAPHPRRVGVPDRCVLQSNRSPKSLNLPGARRGGVARRRGPPEAARSVSGRRAPRPGSHLKR